MSLASHIQEMVGPEFTVEDVPDSNEINIYLRLTSVITVTKVLLKHNDAPLAEIIQAERDKVLIRFKHELTRLLWKYLGEVPE